MEQGRFRVGLRVEDVAAAARFYRELGSFNVVGEIPGPDGRPVMAILEREGALVIVDALEGMPFAETDRERRTRTGPRGLGVSVGLGVDDLDAAYRYCVANGCEVTCEPRDEPYGDRVFEILDPYGYQWEISCPVADIPADQALAAVRREWFGT